MSNSIINSALEGFPFQYIQSGVPSSRQFAGWYAVGFNTLANSLRPSAIVTDDIGVSLKQRDFVKLINPDGSVTFWNGINVVLRRNVNQPSTPIKRVVLSFRYPYYTGTNIEFRLNRDIFLSAGQEFIILPRTLRITIGRT